MLGRIKLRVYLEVDRSENCQARNFTLEGKTANRAFKFSKLYPCGQGGHTMPLCVKQVEAAKPIWDKAKQKWRENRLADGEQLYLVAQKRDKTWRMLASWIFSTPTLILCDANAFATERLSQFSALKPDPERKIPVKPQKRPFIAGRCWKMPKDANPVFTRFSATVGNFQQNPKRAGHGKYNTSYFLPDRPYGVCLFAWRLNAEKTRA